MITFFTTPKPFLGHIDTIQRNALRSWRALSPEVEVIVFGDDQGTEQACAEFNLRHERNVQTNTFGTKRLDYIFGRAQEIASNAFVCYVNCDILLLSDFVTAFAHVSARRRPFLMVGRRWDTPITDSWSDFPRAEIPLREIARASGIQQPSWSIDYFLFPKGLYDAIPPLVVGRIWWDHWLVWCARRQHADVIDVSSQVLAIHQNHDYGYHPKGATGVRSDEQAQSNYKNAGGKWHLYTIDDATHVLENRGERPNYRRFWAPYWRVMRPSVIPWWHKFLDHTRSIRHRFGIRA
jgi:hypothetical protein